MSEPENIAFGERVFQQFLDIFVTPEVKRRQASGDLNTPLVLRAAQIIFFPDGRPPQVRINGEVQAVGEVRLKGGLSKAKGDPILAHEVEGFENLQLDEPALANCGHATIIRVGETWAVAFDFRYNKALSREHLDVASQFVDAAEHCFSGGKWAAMIDNLFSACELTAKAILLVLPDKDFATRTTHNAINSRFNRFGSIGNISSEHLSAFNELRKLRERARYLKTTVAMSRESAAALLNAVKGLHEFAKSRVPPEEGRSSQGGSDKSEGSTP